MVTATFTLGKNSYQADLQQPLEIGIPFTCSTPGPLAYDAPPFQITPVVAGNFIGDVNQGGAVNFMNWKLNPHGNGTHTECVGHIFPGNYHLNKIPLSRLWKAQLISVTPEQNVVGDTCIDISQSNIKSIHTGIEALIIRTLPNEDNKKSRNWTGTNPAYFTDSILAQWADQNIMHLLTDLPSVDKEVDGGVLAGHKAWWGVSGPRLRTQATITEMIFVVNSIPDGIYLLSLNVLAVESDASPSRPVLFQAQMI